MRHPRLRLALVTLLALATLGALLVARPPLSATSWSRGDDLALMTAWAVAAAASVWLFVMSAACTVALACSRPAVARRLAPALPASIRTLVELALVGSCIALPALPAAASTPPPVTAAVVVDQPVVRAPEVAAPSPVAPPPTPETPATATRVFVRPGDNLWLIARRALSHSSGYQPSEAEVARYWHAVMAANRATLRSGNPSLVFPGEIVALPTPTSVS